MNSFRNTKEHKEQHLSTIWPEKENMAVMSEDFGWRAGPEQAPHAGTPKRAQAQTQHGIPQDKMTPRPSSHACQLP